MSAADGPVFNLSGASAVPFSRLFRVELRKSADTRASRWLIGLTVGAALVAAAIFSTVAAAKSLDSSYADFVAAAAFPSLILLPVLGVLTITSEWSQRTAMLTFTLEPSRIRVVCAKLVGLLILAVLAWAITLALGAIAYLLYGAFSGHDVTWASAGKLTLTYLVNDVVAMVGVFALGALFLNSPAGIVVYFVYSLVLPVPFAIGAALMTWFRHLRPWIDLAWAQGPLTDGSITGTQWAHLLTSGLVWVGLPLAIGTWRIRLTEVK
jgi:ABC-type transport system involved in multi-copper enzyme maturation permease subunit